MKPGDIVLIQFPNEDLQLGKLRPALIVAIAPGRHKDLLLALISSRIYQAVPNFDNLISPNDDDYFDSGLKASSVVRLARLISVDQKIIDARLGQISEKRLGEIRKRLIQWLG